MLLLIKGQYDQIACEFCMHQYKLDKNHILCNPHQLFMQQVKAVTFYIVLCNVFILRNTFIHYKMYNSSSKIAKLISKKSLQLIMIILIKCIIIIINHSKFSVITVIIAL